ncbi:hypothetical protein PMI02_00738 [Novosphingobium sp. AP12]|nr:hypothetical protein PMI02_00738 [Novosphingobium sp. AP12]
MDWYCSQEHSRSGLRYSSDMTDRDWEVAAPFIPPGEACERRRTANLRELLNALLYIAASGCYRSAFRRSQPFSGTFTLGAMPGFSMR